MLTLTALADPGKGTVRIYLAGDDEPTQDVIEVDWLNGGQFIRVLWDELRRLHTLPDPLPGNWAPGQVRRDPDAGTTVVCTSRGSYKVIGDDPEPWMYGWRDYNWVASWPVVGNVLELSTGRQP